MVETLGIVGAVEAADVMVKAANVKLMEIRELDVGIVTVIISGDVGAVKNAVETGKNAVEAIGQLHAYNIIPRPEEKCMALFFEDSFEELGGTS